MTLTIRTGDPKSAEGTALLNASHALMTSLYPPEDNYFLSIDGLCVPSITFFIADLNGQAVGCIALANKQTYGEIKSLFVSDTARGSGAGKALMEQLEHNAASQGLTMLKLETGDTLDAAHRLYARHGYAICGPFGEYPEGPHSVFMEKTL